MKTVISKESCRVRDASRTKRKNPDLYSQIGIQFPAESEGFEPPVPLGTTVFKTAAIDHSANSPRQK